jgi:hypothetical protein
VGVPGLGVEGHLPRSHPLDSPWGPGTAAGAFPRRPSPRQPRARTAAPPGNLSAPFPRIPQSQSTGSRRPLGDLQGQWPRRLPLGELSPGDLPRNPRVQRLHRTRSARTTRAGNGLGVQSGKLLLEVPQRHPNSPVTATHVATNWTQTTCPRSGFEPGNSNVDSLLPKSQELWGVCSKPPAPRLLLLGPDLGTCARATCARPGAPEAPALTVLPERRGAGRPAGQRQGLRDRPAQVHRGGSALHWTPRGSRERDAGRGAQADTPHPGEGRRPRPAPPRPRRRQSPGLHLRKGISRETVLLH